MLAHWQLTMGLVVIAGIVLALLRHRRRRIPARLWRLGPNDGGTIVWHPAGYDVSRAAIVVYLGGPDLRASQAWEEEGLEAQFQACGMNSLFVVPDVGGVGGLGTQETGPARVLAAIARGTGLSVPSGSIAIVARGTAKRWLAPWLDELRVRHVVVLGLANADQERLRGWVTESPGAVPRKLTVVGSPASALERLSRARITRGMPATLENLTDEEREARLLIVRSAQEERDLVAGGRAIPVLLRRVSLIDQAQMARETSRPRRTAQST